MSYLGYELSSAQFPNGVELELEHQSLPFENVARVMRMALPENTKIAKEAITTMKECVTEFISFITSEAAEKCAEEKRKTLQGTDVINAMNVLGFENYAAALQKLSDRMAKRAKGDAQPVANGRSLVEIQGEKGNQAAP